MQLKSSIYSKIRWFTVKPDYWRNIWLADRLHSALGSPSTPGWRQLPHIALETGDDRSSGPRVAAVSRPIRRPLRNSRLPKHLGWKRDADGAGWTSDFNKVEDIEKFGEEMGEFATQWQILFRGEKHQNLGLIPVPHSDLIFFFRTKCRWTF